MSPDYDLKTNLCNNPNCGICTFGKKLLATQQILCFCGICAECIGRANEEIENAKRQQTANAATRCECGSDVSGSSRHSTWCPKYGME